MRVGPVNVVTATQIHSNVFLEIIPGAPARISPATNPSASPLSWAVPAFIDLHIHGMGGVGPEQHTPAALLQLSTVLARQGVAAFCPTLYCARPADMTRQLRALVPALGQETGARILGFHLEGPFISPLKPGVMKPQDIAPAQLDDLKRIYEAAQGHISVITLAPEIPHIRPIIEFCLKQHILVQAGHTNATYEEMQRAFDWGIHRVTHLGNAMSGLHHRAPGALGFALLNPKVSVEVIADGHHIHPALLSGLKHIKPISHITAVTDALLPTQQPVGPFLANGQEVRLQEGVWQRTSDGTIAGSALTMAGAFAQLVQAGYTLPQTVSCTSQNAARLCLPAGPAPQLPADWVILSPDFRVQQTILRGRPIA